QGPQILSPSPGSTLSGSTVTFTWSNGAGVSQFALWLGRSPGGADIYGLSQNQGLNHSALVSNIPNDRSKVYVRLWSLLGDHWESADYTYTASQAPQKAVILSPSPGSTLGGSSVTFTWSAGSGVDEYYLDIGRAPGQRDVYAQTQGLNRTVTVTGLPADGNPLYVQIWSLLASGWQSSDYTFTTFKLTHISPDKFEPDDNPDQSAPFLIGHDQLRSLDVLQ